jgi:hypothetical protein
MDFAWIRKLLVTESSLLLRQLDLKIDNISKEDLIVLVIIQTVIIGFISILVLLCYCRKSGNKNMNSKVTESVTPINLKNISNVNNKKENTTNSKSTSSSTGDKSSYTQPSSINCTVVKKNSDEDLNDVVKEIEERENSFTMRFREAEEKRLKHEKNVLKKEIKKQKKAGANASDDDDAGEWKVIKRGKPVEIKTK